MAKSTAVERVQPAGLPALANTPALEIGAEDVALPRIRRAERNSDAVEEGLVPLGSLYSSTGKEDPDPVVLWKPGDEQGLRFYVLSLRKGKSLTEGGELKTWAFNDPDADPEAWTTYDYGVYLPGHDEDVPYKFMFTRTSTPAAKNINLILKKNSAAGPAWGVAFEAVTKQRENVKGKWFVVQVRQVESTPEEVERAGQLAEMIAGTAIERTSTDEPSI